jgi:hypothetical protein
LLADIINPKVVGEGWNEENETYAEYLLDTADSIAYAKIEQFNALNIYDTNSKNFIRLQFNPYDVTIHAADTIVGVLYVDSANGGISIIDNEIILTLED